MDTCERYNRLQNTWKQLPCDINDTYTEDITLVAIKKRFIYGFGGLDEDAKTCENQQDFYKLDT